MTRFQVGWEYPIKAKPKGNTVWLKIWNRSQLGLTVTCDRYDFNCGPYKTATYELEDTEICEVHMWGYRVEISGIIYANEGRESE